MPRVTPEHSEARRQQILDAAHACFLRDGFHQTSMQDIQREAGLSAGAIYLYFKGKDEIILGLAQRILGHVGSLFPEQPVIGDMPVALPDLAAHFLRQADALQREHDIFPIALQIWAEALRNPPMRVQLLRSLDEVRARIGRFIGACQERGIVDPNADPDAFSLALVGLGHGFIVQRSLIGEDILETYLAGVTALLRNAEYARLDGAVTSVPDA